MDFARQMLTIGLVLGSIGTAALFGAVLGLRYINRRMSGK